MLKSTSRVTNQRLGILAILFCST